MKNIKKSLVSVIAFLFAWGAAFGLNISNLGSETPLFREVIASSPIMQNITFLCTLNGSNPLCSTAGLPSARGRYWNDAAKTSPPSGISSSSVFWQSVL